MELIKIYDKTCEVCSMLAGIDEEIADDNGMFFRQLTLEECAKNPSRIRDYVVNVYVNPNEGMIDIPIYLIAVEQGKIQASGVIKTAQELKNLIASHQKWVTSQNASSAPSMEKTVL